MEALPSKKHLLLFSTEWKNLYAFPSALNLSDSQFERSEGGLFSILHL